MISWVFSSIGQEKQMLASACAVHFILTHFLQENYLKFVLNNIQKLFVKPINYEHSFSVNHLFLKKDSEMSDRSGAICRTIA